MPFGISSWVACFGVACGTRVSRTGTDVVDIGLSFLCSFENRNLRFQFEKWIALIVLRSRDRHLSLRISSYAENARSTSLEPVVALQ